MYERRKMHDELTEIDIKKMKDEIAERQKLMPGLLEEVSRTREYGDLSENAEYKCAKQELNANKRRIRFLQNMIKTAVVISTDSPEDVVGLFDVIEVYLPEDDEKETYRIVTTTRNNVFTNNISKESPFGKAVLGHRVGDEVTVQVNANYSYPVRIISIKKGKDDPDLPITK